jgi:hypothetical protein
MKNLLTQYGLCSLLVLAAAAVPAASATINFDVQAASRGGNLTGIPDSPLTIGIATFTGGELLTGEVGLRVDPTGVYASQGLFGSGETNPLVISFGKPVDSVSVFVANGENLGSYTVSDNLGALLTKSLPPIGALGAATFDLPGDGLSTVFIMSSDTSAWSFAIDNVSFTQPTSAPEPESVLLVIAGLLLVPAMLRWRYFVGQLSNNRG